MRLLELNRMIFFLVSPSSHSTGRFRNRTTLLTVIQLKIRQQSCQWCDWKSGSNLDSDAAENQTHEQHLFYICIFIFSAQNVHQCVQAWFFRTFSYYVQVIPKNEFRSLFLSVFSSFCYTDKKENKIFLIYREIKMGSGAKSYMRKGYLIYEEMHKYFRHIWGGR